jgi:ribosomal protein L40E
MYKAENFLNKLKKGGSELFKSAKSAVKLSNEEERLKNIYMDIGKKVHEIYCYGGTLGRYFDDKYMEIQDCENRIKRLKEELESIKGVKLCPVCGKTNPALASFCSKCGANLNGQKPLIEGKSEKKTTDLLEDVAPPPTPEICPNCGHRVSPQDKYCLSCGKKI